jgi:hypothetical protein
MRHLRQYQISSILASVKVIHSLADLPIRCLAAADGICGPGTEIQLQEW